MKLCYEQLEDFRRELIREEKSPATLEKYTRDVKTFLKYCGEANLEKETVLAYKHSLTDKGYAVRSINSMIASLNSFLDFIGVSELKVKMLKLQQEVFRPEDRELTKAEYERLCRTAEQDGNQKLNLIIQTICSTGIRVSELRFITAEAVRSGEATVNCKGKLRKIFITKQLRKKIARYIQAEKIENGPIFLNRKRTAISRTEVWREMKALCEKARVSPDKVYPHNLRHLFARIFYSMEKDIAMLADILGHSNISTTRIYIISTGTEHRKRMEQLRLIV